LRTLLAGHVSMARWMHTAYKQLFVLANKYQCVTCSVAGVNGQIAVAYTSMTF